MAPPLAEVLRPLSFDDVIGQGPLCSEQGVLRKLSQSARPSSLILWGPPGTGKTTIARILAKLWDVTWEPLSAITASTSDLKKRFEKIRCERRFQPPVFFIDEIHHFNRTQQDIFLPYLEDGTIALIGATTQNPSFALNPAFLSRLRVFTLTPLDDQAMAALIERAETKTQRWLNLTDTAQTHLIQWAAGDGRALISMLETLLSAPLATEFTLDTVKKIIGNSRPLGFDKTGEDHFNLISTLHKAIRASDVDAALYWLARLLMTGEDRSYLLRRLARAASEDVGMADPAALSHVIAAWQAFERLGSPEGELMIVQAVIYLATAPKSNAVYLAAKAAMQAAQKNPSARPPLYSLNAPTSLMKEMGYGEGYVYDHDTQEGFSGQSYFPSQQARQTFYSPLNRGFEREITKRLAYWQSLREKKKQV